MEPESHIRSVSFASYVRLVRGNRNFRRLWSAQIVSETGDWFYTLAIYTLLLDLTGRDSSVALALVLQVLPLTFMAFWAGDSPAFDLHRQVTPELAAAAERVVQDGTLAAVSADGGGVVDALDAVWPSLA